MLTATGMELNANASSSNTTISGDSNDTTGSAPGCSFKRINDLTPGDDGPAPEWRRALGIGRPIQREDRYGGE